MRKFFWALGLALLPSLAWAQSNSTIAVTAGSGTNTMSRTYASGNKISGAVVCDLSTEGQCAIVSAAGALSVAPGTATVGNPTGNATAPFAVQEMVSDATNLQRVLAPLALGDGVNGNNMVSVGLWGWNGTTWDRIGATAAAGIKTNIVDGGDVTLGAKADAACSTDNGTCTLEALTKRIAQNLSTLNATAAGSVPAGGNLIGKVGIDQTTPGTTNLVAAGQNGTWTVQPGNTANTTAWKVDGSAVTQPVSGTVQIGNTPNTTPILANPTSQYPSGATPITASATGTTGATTATLAGTSGKTTYICGYSIRANATAATTVTNTITGVITATLSSIMWVAPAASGIGVDEQIFSPCIPASATNTGIAVVSGAPGTGGNVSSRGWGYQL